MATWTTIPDTSLEPGKPIRSIDALALRDNPVAISEGASGAPKIDPINAMAHLGAAGAVGTYAWLVESSTPGTAIVAGNTYAGSSLRYFGFHIASGTLGWNITGGAIVTGTWRACGSVTFSGSSQRTTLFLRIA